ncbi:hypothetical protein GTW25_08710 [Aliihoeflea aestuarii]|jgi:hypothetical protein|uniref:hypothetical protein n=1 Tax=Aliihoeflea aestuarii TaxID=453840 RepID=UPI0020928653|nr:hypothetical protein [Aliihoeflea aestuarii]MCO6391108.1 hypothetical protein [Aliihoeflea aestuarii]
MHSRIAWLRMEIATLGFLIALTVWSVRPLLEEWGLFHSYLMHGLSYQRDIFSLIALRPLHLTPSGMQWILGGGHPIGVGVVAVLLVAARYIVARWAVAPLLSSAHQWLFAMSATALVGWPGLWLARFHPAQLSAVFLFAALGFSIRLIVKPRAVHFAGAAFSVVALLMTYQALALVVAALPLIALFVRDFDWISRLRGVAISAAALGAGLALYLLYAYLVRDLATDSYEGLLIAHLRSVGLWNVFVENVSTSYATVIFGGSLFLISCSLLIGLAILTDWRPMHAVLASILILLTPLLSLVYLSVGHLRDPERALFPATVGASLALAVVCIQNRARARHGVAAVGVLAMLAASTVSAYQVRQMWLTQDSIIRQVQAIAEEVQGPLVIIDNSGRLGDVYTFLEGTLSNAVNVYGTDADIIICTPADVDRKHPYADRYPIQTTRRCEDIDISDRETAYANGWDRIVISR